MKSGDDVSALLKADSERKDEWSHFCLQVLRALVYEFLQYEQVMVVYVKLKKTWAAKIQNGISLIRLHNMVNPIISKNMKNVPTVSPFPDLT